MAAADKQRHAVFVTRRLPGSGTERLTSVVNVDQWMSEIPPSRIELAARTSRCDGLLAMATDTVDEALLEGAPRLRVIANYGAGYNNIDLDACRSRGIGVSNTPGVLTETTADLAWALILCASRRVVEAADTVRRGEWPPFHPTFMLGTDLRGATLGIIGYGQIGKAVARRGPAFNMKVIHHSRRSGHSLREVLEASDIVSLHVPLTEETTGLIGEAELSLMKPTAILVNTSRGPVVDHEALTKALASNQIFAAGLDVTAREPLPADDPILSLRNCIVLPHIGSATYATRALMADMAVDNLLAGLRGEPLPNAVV